jgi:hypothetical protein
LVKLLDNANKHNEPSTIITIAENWLQQRTSNANVQPIK